MTVSMNGLRTAFVILGLTALCGCDLFVDADTRVARAEKLMASYDHRAAMIELKNALQDDADHVRARLLLAEVSLRMGDVPAADKELQRAIQLGADPSQTATLIAEVRLAQGEARTLLAQIDAGELPLEPEQLATVRGKALMIMQQGPAATEAFRSAIAVNSRAVEARIGLAEVSASEGRFQDATALLDEVLEIDPDAAEAHLVKGGIFARQGRYQDAEAALDRASQHASRLNLRQQVGLLVLRGDSQLAQGNLKAAKESHAQLKSLVEDATVTRMLGARIAMADQDYVTASSELQRVVAAAPNFAPAHFLLGAALFAQGNLNQAQTHLQRSVAIAPDNLQARKLLGKVHLRLARPDAAMEVLLPAQQEEANDAQLDALVGLAHLQSGKSEAGVALLERSLAERPDDASVRFELVNAYLSNRDYEKAVKMARSIPDSSHNTQRDQLIITAVAGWQGLAAARAEVDRLIRANPDDVGTLNTAAMFHARQGEFDRARELLGRSQKADPRDTSTLFNQARIEVAEGRLDAASGWLDQVVKIDPQNAAARMGLAELALRRNDTEGAQKLLEELRAQDAQAIEPRLRLARVYLAERRAQDAEAVLREVLARASDRPEVLNAVGEVYLEHERHQQALAQFRAAIQLAPQESTYWFNSARAQLALGDTGAAREALGKCLQLRPDWVPAVGTLAMLDLRAGNKSAALQRVATLKQRSGKDPGVWMLEGDVLFAMNRFQDATDAYEGASDIQPSAALALKSYRARRAGKLSNVAEPLQSWIERQPDDLPVRMILAEAYQQHGQQLKAIEQYQVVVRHSPKNAAALNNLAWLYHLEKDARALDVARSAHSLAPNSPAIADTLGWILVSTGHESEGLTILESAAKTANAPPEVLFHYASALATTGKTAEARRELKQLLQKSEDFAEKDAAARLLEQLSES
jgi:cellulose synthase operon protein C